MSKEGKQIVTRMRLSMLQAAEANQTRRGYWFVKGDKRVFISEGVDALALSKVCDRELSDAKGWDYWIDYQIGPDVDRRPSWANVDQTDRFI